MGVRETKFRARLELVVFLSFVKEVVDVFDIGLGSVDFGIVELPSELVAGDYGMSRSVGKFCKAVEYHACVACVLVFTYDPAAFRYLYDVNED